MTYCPPTRTGIAAKLDDTSGWRLTMPDIADQLDDRSLAAGNAVWNTLDVPLMRAAAAEIRSLRALKIPAPGYGAQEGATEKHGTQANGSAGRPTNMARELRYWAGNGETESQACMLRAADVIEFYEEAHPNLIDDLVNEAKRTAYLEQRLRRGNP